jgi:hypothetical protein
VDAGSILGVPAVWSTFLDDVSAAEPGESEARRTRAVVVTAHDRDNPRQVDHNHAMTRYQLDEDFDEDLDEDDEEDDEDGDEDEEEDDDEDVETWQVSGGFLATGD